MLCIRFNKEHIDTILEQVKTFNWQDFPKRNGWEDGVGYDDLLKLVNYWEDNYNWYKIQDKLNLLPNYKYTTAQLEQQHEF